MNKNDPTKKVFWFNFSAWTDKWFKTSTWWQNLEALFSTDQLIKNQRDINVTGYFIHLLHIRVFYPPFTHIAPSFIQKDNEVLYGLAELLYFRWK